MWVSQALMAFLLLMATTEGYHSELYPLAEKLLPPNEVAPIPMRDVRSGIFWTGSRYSRRGSSDIKKQVKQRADRFYIGSRYGKRSGEHHDYESDLCKFTSFHPLYPCNKR